MMVVTSSDLVSDLDRGWWDDERGGRTREEADCAGLVAYRSLDFILRVIGITGGL